MNGPLPTALRHESTLMKVARRVGSDRLAWSLRRLHCPVARDDLVLEVGSGGNPYYRANVLCDAYIETRERHFVPLVHDRPTVLGFVERLPFRDDAFDFVIASHVLEHSRDPERFLSEIQRVGRAGYIEVPDAFMERLTCYLDHRLEITERAGRLRITKKRAHVHDPETAELFSHRASRIFPEWVAERPFAFHVRYYWSRATGGVQYQITNPDVDCTWPAEHTSSTRGRKTVRAAVHATVLRTARLLLSQNRRNRALDLMRLIRCPACGSTELSRRDGAIACAGCRQRHPIVHGGIIDFTSTA